jgi:hypothetical protein
MGSWSKMSWTCIRDGEPKIAVLAEEDVEADPDRWCSSTECGQELWQIACQWVWNLRLSLGHASAVRRAPRDPRGHHRKKLLPLSWLRKTRRKSMATGLGPQVGDERLVVLQPMPSCYKRMGRCALQREPASTSREVRQENAFTQRAVYVAYQTDCLRCSLREQCLAPGAKGNRARRKSRRPSSLAPTFVC